jgi:hypothetical protein
MPKIDLALTTGDGRNVASGLGHQARDKLARGRFQQQFAKHARRVPEQQQPEQQEQQCRVSGGRTSLVGKPEMWHLWQVSPRFERCTLMPPVLSQTDRAC